VAVSRTYLRRHGRLLRKGGADASTDRAVLRARRAPGNGGRLSADRRGGRTGAQGGAHVSHGEAGTRSAARLAHGGGGDACRDGEHRRLLAPGLCRAGGARRADRRQCPSHPQRARAQDRREGRRVDRRSGPPRADRQELCAARTIARAARVAALSPQTHRGPSGGTQPSVGGYWRRPTSSWRA